MNGDELSQAMDLAVSTLRHESFNKEADLIEKSFNRADVEPQKIDRIVRNLVSCLSHAKTSTGYCCCGSAEKDHNSWYDGHSYTDEGEYYSWLSISDAEQVLGYHLLDKPGTPSVRVQLRMLLKTIKEKICGCNHHRP
ncbi:hypothetical protein [Burkholderia phage BCSR129]|nr:hypothetical protein [Burkholderia phage BCSR129]